MSDRVRLVLALLLASGLAASQAHSQGVTGEPSPEGARVYFITPEDGATVTSPLTVRFGLEGMGVAPAGTQKEATGHHHLIVDADTPPADRPIAADDHHIHFGGGQTETTLELAPGEHTLQLVVGDFKHVPHDEPVVSKRITVHVE